MIVTEHPAVETFPLRPMGLEEAIGRALAASQEGNVPTSFVDADLVLFRSTTSDPAWSGGTVLEDVRTAVTAARPGDVFTSLAQIGGTKGWYAAEVLWRLRGFLDQIVGGPGLRRGRPAVLNVGDPLDFWQVEDLAPRVAFGSTPRCGSRAKHG